MHLKVDHNFRTKTAQKRHFTAIAHTNSHSDSTDDNIFMTSSTPTVKNA